MYTVIIENVKVGDYMRKSAGTLDVIKTIPKRYKDLLTAKGFREQQDKLGDAMFRAGFNNTASKIKGVKAMDTAADNIPELKRLRNKELLKTVGAYAIPVSVAAAAYGAKKMHDRKKKEEAEKTALELLDEMCMEKQAGILSAIDSVGDKVHGWAWKKFSPSMDAQKARIAEGLPRAKNARLVKNDVSKFKNLGKGALIATGAAATAVAAKMAYDKFKKSKSDQKEIGYPDTQQLNAQPAPMTYQQPFMGPYMQATAALDDMFYEKLAEDETQDNSDIVDVRAVMPKLREQIKISTAAQKVRLPGGKQTPTKFVQRKNQERYQA